VAGQIHPKFLRFLWVLVDKQTRNHYALIGAEEEIGSEAFTWSPARTFSFNKNFIGKAVAYATATRLYLSVHITALPSRRQAGPPISSAECLMHGAAHALQRAAPCPTSPRPAVNVEVGAPSIAPSAHAYREGASGEVDMVDDGTHAAGGVATAEWLAATLGGGDVAAGGAGARNSTYDDAQSDDDDDELADVLEAILGQVVQPEDTGCDEDGVDVSVGVDVDTVVGVSVHGQGVNLGVGLGVGLVVAPPTPHFPRLLGSPSEIWESYDSN